MQSLQRTLDVDVPAATAYDQWARFDDWPRFIDGIEEVRRIDDTHLHWRASIDGKPIEWDCVITKQVPNEVIAWRSTAGAANAGHLRFDALGPDSTRVSLRVDYEPESIAAQPGDALGLVSRVVERVLGDFKDFLEMRGADTGALRSGIGDAREAGR